MINLDKYPNLQAILAGKLSGAFRNWSAIRGEFLKLMAEVEQTTERITELETALKLVQRWGKDSRSAEAYEVFQGVAKALDPVAKDMVWVADCSCIPCICGDRCLGCGARTCLAHELAKGGVKT